MCRYLCQVYVWSTPAHCIIVIIKPPSTLPSSNVFHPFIFPSNSATQKLLPPVCTLRQNTMQDPIHDTPVHHTVTQRRSERTLVSHHTVIAYNTPLPTTQPRHHSTTQSTNPYPHLALDPRRHIIISLISRLCMLHAQVCTTL